MTLMTLMTPTIRADISMRPSTGAWSREAQRVREQARRRGLVLDEGELAFLDVRDLQALCACLFGRRAGTMRTYWTALLGLRAPRAGRA